MKIKNIFTIKIVIVFLLIISALGNLYWFGGNWLKSERAKYYNAGVIYVFQQGEKTGQVNYTNQDGKTIKLLTPEQCAGISSQ